MLWRRTMTSSLSVLGLHARCRDAIRKAGRRVTAIIDFRPYGGTCALRGCDPKKMLRGGADVVDHAERMHGKGVVGDASIDWPHLMAFKRSFTDPVPQKHEQS